MELNVFDVFDLGKTFKRNRLFFTRIVVGYRNLISLICTRTRLKLNINRCQKYKKTTIDNFEMFKF